MAILRKTENVQKLELSQMIFDFKSHKLKLEIKDKRN